MLVYLGVMLWAVLLGWWVYRYDLFDKAPRWMLAMALVAGWAVTWVLSFAEEQTAAMFHVSLGDVSGWAMIAATHEELAKLGIVALLALFWRRRFHDPMDGIIYGAFAGLGVAIQESLLYLSLHEEPGVRELGVEAVRYVLHAGLGGLSAFGVGLLAAGRRRWPQTMAAWLATSVALHYLWNYCVGLRQGEIVSHAPLARTVAVTLVLLTLAAFGGSLLLASRWSRQKYAPGSSLRLWGWPFTALSLPDKEPGFAARTKRVAPQAARRAA